MNNDIKELKNIIASITQANGGVPYTNRNLAKKLAQKLNRTFNSANITNYHADRPIPEKVKHALITVQSDLRHEDALLLDGLNIAVPRYLAYQEKEYSYGVIHLGCPVYVLRVAFSKQDGDIKIKLIGLHAFINKEKLKNIKDSDKARSIDFALKAAIKLFAADYDIDIASIESLKNMQSFYKELDDFIQTH
jgi:hypothetical protein